MTTRSQFPAEDYDPVDEELLPEKRTKFLDLVDFALELLFDTNLSSSDVTNRAYTLGRQVETEFHKLATEDRKRVLIAICWVIGTNGKVLAHLNNMAEQVGRLTLEKTALEEKLLMTTARADSLGVTLVSRDASIKALEARITAALAEHVREVSEVKGQLGEANSKLAEVQRQLTFEQSVVAAARTLIDRKDEEIAEKDATITKLRNDLRIAADAIKYYKSR